MVGIVRLKMVMERGLLYKDCAILSFENGYSLFKQFLGILGRGLDLCRHEEPANSD